MITPVVTLGFSFAKVYWIAEETFKKYIESTVPNLKKLEIFFISLLRAFENARAK